MKRSGTGETLFILIYATGVPWGAAMFGFLKLTTSDVDNATLFWRCAVAGAAFGFFMGCFAVRGMREIEVEHPFTDRQLYIRALDVGLGERAIVLRAGSDWFRTYEGDSYSASVFGNTLGIPNRVRVRLGDDSATVVGRQNVVKDLLPSHRHRGRSL